MENLLDIKIQGESDGVKYGGYEEQYKLCIFRGKGGEFNERYEMRCRPDEACCDNYCCKVEAVAVPFWLTILFIALALLLFLLALGTLAWWCNKRKPKPKPPPKPKKADIYDARDESRSQHIYEHSKNYQPLATDDHFDRLSRDENLDHSLRSNRYGRTDERFDRTSQRSGEDFKLGGDNAHGYVNPIYTPKSALRETYRRKTQGDKLSDIDSQNTVIERTDTTTHQNGKITIPVENIDKVRRQDEISRYTSQLPEPYPYGRRSPWRREGYPDDRGGYVKETFEEKFEEKYSTEEYPDSNYTSPTQRFPRP